MSGRFFLDTNIFVSSFDAKAEVKAGRARELIENASDTGKGIVSFQVVQEFFNVALRRFPQPMTTSEAEEYLSTVFRPLLAIHSAPVLYGEALGLAARYRFGWDDSLILAAALEGKCQILYSEGLQHGRDIEGFRIENPFR
jgi:predicted nucleic acid-binding protein